MNHPERILFIDAETTGLDPYNDEIVSLAIVDGNGETVFYDYIRPEKRRRWPNATEINGITWKDVKDKKTLMDHEPELGPVFANAKKIVGYNIDFDIRFLIQAGIPLDHVETFCVMKEFSSVYGRWSEWKQRNNYVSLVKCADYYGFKFKPHDALEDAKTTRNCYARLMKDPNYLRKIGQAPENKEQEEEESGGFGAGCMVGVIVLLLLIVFVLLF